MFQFSFRNILSLFTLATFGYLIIGTMLKAQISSLLLKSCLHASNVLTDFENFFANWNVITGHNHTSFQEEKGSLIIKRESKFCQTIYVNGCHVHYSQTILYFVAIENEMVNFLSIYQTYFLPLLCQPSVIRYY
jgi:hypothetical protein